MTKILALDTSTIACSAALMIDNEISEEFIVAPMQHAQQILPMIERLLKKGDISFAQLDAIAFGRGPGSFTGVRIAASVVQGLAFSHDIPVIPISTLAAVAQGMFRLYQANQVLVALDARMEEVYWGVYEADGNKLMRPIAPEQVTAPNLVRVSAELLLDKQWVGAGDGWASYQNELKQNLSNGTIKTIFPQEYPHAYDIAILGKAAWNKGLAVMAADAIPVYLRDNVTFTKPT